MMRATRSGTVRFLAWLALWAAGCGGSGETLFEPIIPSDGGQNPWPDASSGGHAGASGAGSDAAADAAGETGPKQDGASEACVPATCNQLGAECGEVSDECGGTLQCGACPAGEQCGAGGPNLCGVGPCVPKTCAALGAECGQVSDGCGKLITCPACVPPETCGGAGQPNQCGCTALSCAQTGAECGSLPDGCGQTIQCGTCPVPKVCGSVQPNKCGDTPCVPTTCGALGYGCGFASDGCSSTLDCGTCPWPQTCGGGGTPNQCGCTPTNCAAQNATCGDLPDGCGGTLPCGVCTGYETCGGGGVPQQCGCTPVTCAQAGAKCGTIVDGCGGSKTCGSCTLPLVCGGAGEPNQCDIPIVTLASGIKPWVLAIDSTRVYWGGSSIGSVDKNGGTTTTIAAGQEYVEGLALGAGGVFWSEYFSGDVWTAKTDGSGLTKVAGDTANAIGVAHDGTQLYWAWNNLTNGGRVMTKAGASPTAVVSGLSDVRYLAIYSGRVYYTITPNQVSQGRVRSVSLTGSTPVDVATGQYEAHAVAVDASGVYWTNHAAYQKVMRANHDGTGQLALVSSQNRPFFLALDATHVYWTNEGSPASQYKDGVVLRVPKAGGSPQVLADKQAHPAGIVVDATSVYWANAGNGTIVKINK